MMKVGVKKGWEGEWEGGWVGSMEGMNEVQWYNHSCMYVNMYNTT